MTRTIYLNGKMGELFGKVWKLNAATVAECMHGIDCQREGKLKKYLMDCTEQGIMFTVQRGEEFLDYDNLQMNLAEDDLIITPVPAGSGNKLLKVIVGFMLMVGAAMLLGPGGAVAAMEMGALKVLAYAGTMAMGMIGSALLNSGVAEYMAPKKAGEKGDAFLFDGPVNNVKEGIPVPLAYGQVLVGGATISFGFSDHEVSSSSGFRFSQSTGGVYSSSTSSPPNSSTAIAAESTTPASVDAQVSENIDWNFDGGNEL
jgi:predicted phage tail protein